MFEIDENTRYSLRLLGRGSLVMVSLALILAVIGYVLRDSGKQQPAQKMDKVFVASRLEMSQEYQPGNLSGKQVTIKGKPDSLSRNDEVTELYFFQNASRNMIFCRIAEPSTLSIKAGKGLIVRGVLRGSRDNMIFLDDCKIIE